MINPFSLKEKARRNLLIYRDKLVWQDIKRAAPRVERRPWYGTKKQR